jgi:hypothetical protein
MRRGRVGSVCCEPGCEQPRYCYGRCVAHFRQMDPQIVKRLKRLPKSDREAEFQKAKAQPERRWEYEPSPEQEVELVEKYGEKSNV